MFISIFSHIGVIFIILAVGALARWRKLISQETTDGLARIAIEVTIPFLYFYSLSKNLNFEMLKNTWFLPFLACGLILFSYGISWIICRRLKLNSEQQKSFLFLGSFTNYGFLAIPLVYALFGEETLVKLIMFNLGVSLMYWSFGVGILSSAKKRGFRLVKNLCNTATLALTLGIIVGATQVKMPEFITESARLIGDASIPLALIVVGSVLAGSIGKSSSQLSAIVSLVVTRLIFIPVLVTLLVKDIFNLPKMIAVIIIIQAAMPSASTTPILTQKFGGDTQFAAKGVFFTTIFSILTIPLFISWALK